MNCQDVLRQMTAYADGELSSSEKMLIGAHLAACPACQQAYEATAGLQKQLQQHLQARAGHVAPRPQAWTRLEAALPSQPPRQRGLARAVEAFFFSDWVSARRLSLQKVAMALLLLMALVVAVPPAWARLEPIITNWFRFTSPDGQNSGSIGGFTAFTPYHATYLPEGLQPGLLGGGTAPDLDTFEIGYNDEARFITIFQSKGDGATALPVGEPVQVGGNTAVFIQDFAVSQADFHEKRPAVSLVTDYDYSHVHLLAWFMGEVKIELFSNLPLAEMLLVAKSLEPMQAATEDTFNPRP